MSWPGLSERLEGRLAVLEPLRREHGPGLRLAAEHPEIWHWMPANAGESEDAFARWLDAALAAADAGSEVPFATVDRRSGRVVGSTRFLTLRPEHRGLEIGWTWFASDVWQSGINVDAKLLMLEHAFERHGCMRVEFKTDARNERSRAALAALPARSEGVFRRHMLVRGGDVRDSAYYAITDEEWPGVRAALERRLEAKLAAR